MFNVLRERCKKNIATGETSQAITPYHLFGKDKEGYQHRRCYRGCVILLGLVWFTQESVIKEPNQIIMQSQLSLVEDLSAHS